MAQESTADLFARIKPSLGLVVTTKSLGTAFCIHSTPTASYYITNAHVVGSEQEVTVFRQFPSVRKLAGLVVARGLDEDPDLAVIKVAFGNVPALSLNTGDLREGDPIAIAGYPSAPYTFAEITGSLLPAVHSGTISAIANRGGVIEYDAQTLPGNSGGPLFDQRTGAVDGIVQAKLKGTTDANIAIGVARVIAPFLNKNGVSFTRSAMSAGGSSESASVQDPDPSTLRALPGADMVAVIYDDSRATGQNTGNYIAEAAADFAVKLGRAFNVQTVVVDAPTPDAQTVGSVARANSALIGVPYGVAFHGLGSYTNAFGTTSKWTFSLSAALIDSFGVSWVSSGRVEKTEAGPLSRTM
jgi:S1-C subfamily serine protease